MGMISREMVAMNIRDLLTVWAVCNNVTGDGASDIDIYTHDT